MVDVDLRNVVSHLANGTLAEELCRVCLCPLDEACENVFTEICKENTSYCIADVLQSISQLELNTEDNYCVCSSCFHMASVANKFYTTCQRTEAILGFYIKELEKNIQQLQEPMENNGESIFISLPLIVVADNLDYIADPTQEYPEVPLPFKELKTEREDIEKSSVSSVHEEADEKLLDEDIIVILDETGKRKYYKTNGCGELEQIDKDEKKNYELVFRNSEVGKNVINTIKEMRPKKVRKVRSPMGFIQCAHCPVKYRFHSKLKDHMKADHAIILYICKLCKFTTEQQQEYHTHMETHTDIYTCDECGKCFKKRATLIEHLKSHQDLSTVKVKEGAHICEMCGQVLPSLLHLKEHNDKKHVKKYTCFYCARSYKGEVHFEAHIKKHEKHLDKKEERHTCAVCQLSFSSLIRLDKHSEAMHGGAPALHCAVEGCGSAFRSEAALKAHQRSHNSQFTCETCHRGFVDARALLWHQRLHTNERPYKCEECGRGFISAYRRNTHAQCAHTAPTRRCPLCPSLFHLRSMVNSHIRRVHLKAHKRRSRSNKWTSNPEVTWRTEPVPLQDLSVAIQTDLLELRTGNMKSN